MNGSEPKTIPDWQALFDRIYGDRNANLSLETACLHIMEEVGEVAKDLRREDYSRLREDLPDVFAWLCAFCGLSGIKLEDAIWEKYPRVCPYCLKSQHCVCVGGSYPKYIPSRVENYKVGNKRPIELDEWLKMFKTIYGNVNSIVMTPGVGLHLMEEIGEMAKILRRDNDETHKHRESVADVFAWIMALAMKHIDSHPSFNQIVWKVYPGRCKSCQEEKCRCNSLPLKLP